MAISLGNEFVFASGSIEIPVVRALSNEKFVIAWRDVPDSDKGKTRIGTVSGTTITYGPIATFCATSLRGQAFPTQINDIIVLGEDRYLIAYAKIDNYAYSQVCTISGSTIASGVEYKCDTIPEGVRSVACSNYTSSEVHLTCRYSPFGGLGSLQHCVISVIAPYGESELYGINYGDAIGHGTNVQFPRVVALDETHALIAWRQSVVVGPEKYYGIIVERDGDSLSIDQSKFQIAAGVNADENALALLSIDGDQAKVIVSTNINDIIQASYLATDDQIITLEDQETIKNTPSTIGAMLVKDDNEFDIIFQDINDSSYGKVIHGTIVNDKIRQNDAETWHSAAIVDHHACVLDYPIAVAVYRDTANSNYGTARIIQFGEVNEILGAQCDLYIPGQLESSSINLYLYGYNTIVNDIDQYIEGYQITSGNIHLFLQGHNQTLASGNLFIDTYNITATSGTLFISGSGIINESGIFHCFINGYEPKPPLACPILDPTTSIQIKDSLIRIYQSRIDALINQLGKNVYLEFDSLSELCPNCDYDTLRRRSTGMYKIGGPRPFQRGRKCSYCKGKGFIETKVYKCIKCLIKWNPKDAENFGIVINRAKSIVRFKTYLTEAKNLIKAKTAIANYDIVNQKKLIVRLIKGPIPVGLRESRYCISFWELL